VGCASIIEIVSALHAEGDRMGADLMGPMFSVDGNGK
jgi:hypothetical protein